MTRWAAIGLTALTFCVTSLQLGAIASNRALASQSPAVESDRTSDSICPAQLGAAIDAAIDRPQFSRARWGILIEPLSSTRNDALYRREAEEFFIPASNVKLLTTAAALRLLGSEFRMRTSVYDVGGGTLRVVGRGDPSLTDAQLRELAQQLKRRGVRSVQQLIIDDSYFPGNAVNLTWEWGDVQAAYATAANSSILNQNAVKLTLSPQQVGQPVQVSWSDAIAGSQWRVENQSVTAAAGTPPSLAVNAILGQPVLRITGQLPVNAEPTTLELAIFHPAQYFLQRFRVALAAEGIRVIRASANTEAGTVEQRELAAVESPPLSVLLAETNQASNNLYAEVLLRSLQASAKPLPANGDSAQRGLEALKAALTDLGVDPESYKLADGSGLSRHNLVSPEAIARTLKLMAQTPQAAVYRASLPVAGVSGTLQNRFRDTAARGIVQAKTGSMSGVSALSGYLDVPGYQPLVFSIIVNQSDQTTRILRQAIDEVVLLLTRLRSC